MTEDFLAGCLAALKPVQICTADCGLLPAHRVA